ncbi:MAG: hypothetical protein LBT36_05330 [Oscillospiraceae bacterium]|jgi:hypothetical protein|nr:hypothetical protein [Oscillospiraceae bacterium]
MKKLRIIILGCFALSVAVTASSAVFTHSHALHMAHIAAVTATFLLLALYLHRSARYASEAPLLELKRSFPPWDYAVGEALTFSPGDLITADCEILAGQTEADESALTGKSARAAKTVGDRLYRGTVNLTGRTVARTVAPAPLVSDALKAGEPLFNPFAAMLAKSGILVRDAAALKVLQREKILAPRGIGVQREGFAMTRETLRKAGITLAETEDAASPVVLCAFPDFNPKDPISITHDKAAHLVKAVYCARRYARLRRLRAAAMVLCALFAAVLCLLRQFMLVGTAPALYKAACLYILRRAERDAERRLSFSVFDRP